MGSVLFIVLPCYNEHEVLRQSADKVANILERLINSDDAKHKISEKSRILFVDDGSKDNTWDLIKELCDENSAFMGIRLSKNKGHQIAIFSGMQYAVSEGADCVVTIDADLQQDIEALPRFLEKYYSGCDIVYGYEAAWLRYHSAQCRLPADVVSRYKCPVRI